MKISEIKADARQKLKDKWGRGALIVLGFIIFQLALSSAGALPIIGFFVAICSIVIMVPINYGLEKSFFDFYHGKEVSLFDCVESGFKNFTKAWSVAWRTFLALLIPTIITLVSAIVTIIACVLLFLSLFLGLFSAMTDINILATIALYSGIIYVFSAFITAILALKYVLARLISIDHPDLTGLECISESRVLMKGNILKYIFLNLSFIGWAFLTIFTLGIGIFWLAPYMQISLVAFYRSLKPEDKSVLYEVDDIVNK